MQSLTPQTVKQTNKLFDNLEDNFSYLLKERIEQLKKQNYRFIAFPFDLINSYSQKDKIVIGIDNAQTWQIILALEHEIAHREIETSKLPYLEQIDKVKCEINAWKKALEIFNLTFDKRAFEFIQILINSYSLKLFGFFDSEEDLENYLVNEIEKLREVK